MRIINRKLRNNLFTGNFKAAKKSQQNFFAALFILETLMSLFLETGGNTYAGNEK